MFNKALQIFKLDNCFLSGVFAKKLLNVRNNFNNQSKGGEFNYDNCPKMTAYFFYFSRPIKIGYKSIS